MLLQKKIKWWQIMEALQKRILGLAQNQYNEGENEVDFVGQLLHFYRQQTERSVYQNTTCGGVSGFQQNERIMIEQWEAHRFKKVKQNFFVTAF